jgi:hypothetical protein
MANTQAMTDSFKTELMNGHHAFGVSIARADTTKDAFKAALYFASAAINKTTTIYTTTGEINDASYTAGGIAVTNAQVPQLTTPTVYWTPSASLQWTSFTEEAFNAVLLYNSTRSNKSVACFTFGSQTVVAGTFTLNMPVDDATTGLIRLT